MKTASRTIPIVLLCLLGRASPALVQPVETALFDLSFISTIDDIRTRSLPASPGVQAREEEYYGGNPGTNTIVPLLNEGWPRVGPWLRSDQVESPFVALLRVRKEIDAAQRRELTSPDGVLSAAWLEKFSESTGLRLRLTVSQGVTASLAAVSTRNFVSDLEMVSGGTADQIVEVGDPIIDSIARGLTVDLRVRPLEGGDLVELTVGGDFTNRVEFGRQIRARGDRELDSARTGPGAPARSRRLVLLDLPRASRERWDHSRLVPFGRPVLLGALPDPESPDKTRVRIALVQRFDPRAR